MSKEAANINNKSKKNEFNILPYIGLGILIPIVLLYIIVSFYYNSHFYMNTYVNGVNASNLTVSQIEDAINDEVKEYKLTLNGRNDITGQIHGQSIKLITLFNGDLKELLKKQSSFLWPASFFKTHNLEIATMFEYDKKMLAKQIDKLDFFKDENMVEPENAHISEYGENGFEVIPENKGAKVNKDKLTESIKKALISLEPEISLDDANTYEAAKITSDNPQLLEDMKEMNNIVKAKITYEFGHNVEVLDGSKISKWLYVDENNKVKVSPEKIKEYVDYIGKTYNSFGRTRSFKTSYGDVIEIKGGDYGWWLDRSTEVKQLTELILNGANQVKEPAYFQTAQQHGDDDIGNTYVEINLTAQHLFFYKEGKLIVDTDFVSGNLAKNYGTPTGTFPIQYKTTDATLRGEDYATPVNFWMPFNGNVGMHDAYWRSEFGGKIYKTSGSHGCINLPPAAAKVIYENIKRGVAVLVYELPGTESYDKDKDKDKVKDKEKDKQVEAEKQTEKVAPSDTTQQ